MHAAVPSRLAIAAALATVYVVWGSTYLAIKYAVLSVPPLMMAGVRFFVAGAVLYAIVRPYSSQKLEWKHWGATGLVGGLLLIGGNGPVCWAMQFVPSGIGALIIATVPLWFVMLDWLLFRGRPPTMLTLVGLAAGLVGVYFLMSPGKFGTTGVPIGGALALLSACAFWALGSLLSRRMPLPASPWMATAMEMLTASVVLVILSVATGELRRSDLRPLDLRAAVSLVYLIVFGSLIAFSAYVWLLGVCTPAVVSTYAYVNPVIAVFLGAALNNETINARLVFGATAIVVAVLLITTQAPRKPPQPADDDRGETAAPADLPAATASPNRRQAV